MMRSFTVLLFCCFLLALFADTKPDRFSLAETDTEPSCPGCISIVSVWKRVPTLVAKQWLYYHLFLGFSRIYLFLDAPQEEKGLMDLLMSFEPAVRVINATKEYKARWWEPCLGVCQDCACRKDPEQFMVPGLGVYHETEFTARHLLYVSRAAALAGHANVGWLLHIDADELFFLPTDITMAAAARHFEALTGQGYTHAQFLNDEVIPAKLEKMESYFDKEWFFKKNIMMPDVRKAEKSVKWLSYLSGKGAINVPAWKRNMNDVPILPHHVTGFAVYGMCAMKMQICRDMANDFDYDFEPVPVEKVKIAIEHQHARVLHYPIASLDQLVRRLKNRATLPTTIFDIDPVSVDSMNKYGLSRHLWWHQEELPGHSYFKPLYDIVTADGRKLGPNANKWIKEYVLLPQSTAGTESLLEAGLIQLREDTAGLVKLALEVGEGCTAGGNSSNSSNGECGAAISRNKNPNPPEMEAKWLTCEHRGPIEDIAQKFAPHYWCDFEEEEECCEVLRLATFEFEKRMLGYKWYDVHELWADGVEWPEGGKEVWLKPQRESLGVTKPEKYEDLEYWRGRIEDEFGKEKAVTPNKEHQEVVDTLTAQFHWRSVADVESMRMYYQLLQEQAKGPSKDEEGAPNPDDNAENSAAKDEL